MAAFCSEPVSNSTYTTSATTTSYTPGRPTISWEPPPASGSVTWVSYDMATSSDCTVVYNREIRNVRTAVYRDICLHSSNMVNCDLTLIDDAVIRVHQECKFERCTIRRVENSGAIGFHFDREIDGTRSGIGYHFTDDMLRSFDGQYIQFEDVVLDTKKPRELSFNERMQLLLEQKWIKHCMAEDRKCSEAAEEKAQALLGSLIGPEELETYKKTGRLFVKGKNGVYHAKRDGGIARIEGNKIINFCVHLERKYKCPPTDHVIAMKLLLEDNDKQIINIANRMSTQEVEKLPLAACM